jgi:hypothetical protein
MGTLSLQKCLNHSDREAVARCPQCRSHFCRECVSEHQGRILCAQCLSKAASPKGARTAARIWLPAGAGAGIMLAWLFFLALGKILALIPAAYHDGAWTGQIESGNRPR